MSSYSDELQKKFLEAVVEKLDIPPAKFHRAVERYTKVGEWLKQGKYAGTTASPEIYPQGSFRLGTVVRPLKNDAEGEYDIDLVCELQQEKIVSEEKEVKASVGRRLRENEQYSRMLEEEGRRCWTLNYPEEEDDVGFHMDVLPCIPETAREISTVIQAGVPEDKARTAIAITNRHQVGKYEWKPGNPKGYAEWFADRQKAVFENIAPLRRNAVWESNRSLWAKVDDVPSPLVKTPLQMAIQILKRHRDAVFMGKADQDDKPISMIITTVSAQLYDGEEDVYNALLAICSRLESHAEMLKEDYQYNEKAASRYAFHRKPDKWEILNPVNPAENFADKWHEKNNARAYAFFRWIASVKKNVLEALQQEDVKRIADGLKPYLGKTVIDGALAGLVLPRRVPNTAPAPQPSVLSTPRSPARPQPVVIGNNPPKPWRAIE